jgi:hypothetical protein
MIACSGDPKPVLKSLHLRDAGNAGQVVREKATNGEERPYSSRFHYRTTGLVDPAAQSVRDSHHPET